MLKVVLAAFFHSVYPGDAAIVSRPSEDRKAIYLLL
jgi:hypothetical protein